MQLIVLILTACLLEFLAIIGGVALYNMLIGLIRIGQFDNDDTRTICLLLITIAICLVGAVHVMPA